MAETFKVIHDKPDGEGKVKLRCPHTDCTYGKDGGRWSPADRVRKDRAVAVTSMHLSRYHGHIGTSVEAQRYRQKREAAGLRRNQRDPKFSGVFVLTPEQQAEVVALRQADPVKWSTVTLGKHAGVSPHTIRRVLERARNARPVERPSEEEIERLVAEAEEGYDVSKLRKRKVRYRRDHEIEDHEATHSRAATAKPKWDDLADSIELAEMLGVTRGRVYVYAREPDFPPPRGSKRHPSGHGTARLWSRSEVQGWHARRGDPQPEEEEPPSEAPSAPVVDQEAAPAPEPTPAPLPEEVFAVEEPTELEQFAHALMSDAFRYGEQYAAVVAENQQLRQEATGVEALQQKLAQTVKRNNDLESDLRDEKRRGNALRETNERLMREHAPTDTSELEARIKELEDQNERLRLSENAAVVDAARKGTAIHGIAQGYLERNHIPQRRPTGTHGGIGPSGNDGRRMGYRTFGPEIANPVIDRRTAEKLMREAPESAKATD